MAYQYRGLGSQVQADTSGYNLMNNALSDLREHNPIQAIDNLIGNYQVTQARNALLNSANPYDGLTTYQKLQQLGLTNNYILEDLNNLNTAYNTETSNIKAARQAASDFNTEALLAEAYRVRASGDPAQIAAFNNKLAQSMSAMVASGAVTPETASKLYTNLNPVKQEVANIGLTKGQTAQAYAGARQANAGALLNELAANDKIAEQYSLADYKTLISNPSHPVTGLDSAIALGRAYGWSDARTIAAYNAGKLPAYNKQWGSVNTDIGTISANLPSYGLGNTAPVSNVATQSNQNASLSSTGQSVPSNSRRYTAASLAEEAQNTSNPNAVMDTVSSRETSSNVENQSNISNTSRDTNGTIATASDLATQQPEVSQETASVPTATTQIPNNLQSTTATSNQPVQSTIGQTTTINPPTTTPTITEPTATAPQRVTPEVLQDTTSAVQQPTIATNTQQVQEANTLNNIADENTIAAGGGIVKINNSTGKPYIDIGDNALINSKTGTWDFNKNVPLDRTNIFDIRKADETLKNINRDLGGNGIISRLWSFDYDSDSGTISWTPTQEQLDYIKKNPRSETAFKNIENKLTEAVKPLLTPDNLAGGLSYLSAAFGSSNKGRKANFNKLESLLYASKNQNVSDSITKTLENTLQFGGAPTNIEEIADTNLTNLYNVANNGTPEEIVNTLVNSNIPQTQLAVSTAVAQGENSKAPIQQVVKTFNAKLSFLKNVETLKNLYNESGGSATKLIATMQTGENAKNPFYQATLKALVDNGVLIPVTTSDGKQSADDLEVRYELNAKTSGEFFTALEKYKKNLQSELGLPSDYAMANAIASSVIANRTIGNSLINSLSDTNNMQIINEQIGFDTAAQIKNYLISPEGMNRFNELNQLVSNTQAALDKFSAAGTDLNNAMASLNQNTVDLEKNFNINIRQLPDGTEYKSAVPRNNIGINILRYGEGIPREFIKNARDASKKAKEYTDAAAGLSVYGGLLLQNDIINKNMDQLAQHAQNDFRFLNESNDSKSQVNTLSPNAWPTSYTPYAGNAVYTIRNSTNNNFKDFQNNLEKFSSNRVSNNPTISASNLLDTSDIETSVKNHFKDVAFDNELLNMGATNPAAYTISAENSEREYGITQSSIETYTLAANTPYKDIYGNTIMGSPVAQERLGDLYLKGVPNLLKKDSDMAEAYYTQAAKQGNAEAQYKLGMYYNNNKNYTQAFLWIKQAAERGNLEAQRVLGLFYLKGYGNNQINSKNKEKTARDLADYWFGQAVDQEKRLRQVRY